jgi:outer membrane protein assembly factor BamE (lipoprotein component of BamABCDE complex)
MNEAEIWEKVNELSKEELIVTFDKNGKPKSYYTFQIINTQAIPKITRKRNKHKK